MPGIPAPGIAAPGSSGGTYNPSAGIPTGVSGYTEAGGSQSHGIVTSIVNDLGLGGVANDVGHVAGQTVHDVSNLLINAPAGAVKTVGSLITDPVHTVGLLGKGIAQDFRHPLAHPVYTALDFSNLLDLGAGAAARVAEAGRIAERAGAPAAELTDAETAKNLGRTQEYNRAVNPVTKAAVPVDEQIKTVLTKGIPRQERVINLPKVTGEGFPKEFLPRTIGDYSKGFTVRSAQKLVDAAHAAFPDARIPLIFKTQASRYGKAERYERIYQENILRQPAAALVRLARGLSKPEQVAVRVVGEGASIPERIAFHQAQIDSGTLIPRMEKESEAEIELLKKAQEYITMGEVGGHATPLIKPEFTRLQQVVDQSRRVTNGRELLLGNVLHTPNAINRKLGPVRVIRGEGLPEISRKVENELKRLKGLQTSNPEKDYSVKITDAEARLKKAKKHEENPATLGGKQVSEQYLQHLFRVPYATAPSFRAILGKNRFEGGRIEPPSTVTHAFTAGFLKGGGGRNDAANLIAESYTEAARYSILAQARHAILQLAADSPQDLIRQGVPEKFIIAVNRDILRRGLNSSDVMRQWRAGGLDEKETFSNLEDAQATGQRYDELRKEIFADKNSALANDPRYGFIDSRLLGGLDKPNPLSSVTAFGAGREGLHFVDAINNAVKAAILYLKPAYLFPNWLGNVALGFVHQGFAAPANLVKAARLEHSIGSDAVAAIDVGMGGGLTDVLEPTGGKLQAVSRRANKIGNAYGKIIDDPSRRAAFYHEANLHGYTTADQIKELVTDPKRRDEFATVAQRASQEIIDYQRLNPWEQSVIRRVIFFYPWLKGSSRYAAHFFANHPGASLANTQLSKVGEDWQNQEFGKLPSYAEGLIPLFGKKNRGNPYAINPSSASILGSPGDLVETVANLFSKHPNKDLNFFHELSPFNAALLTGASGSPVSGPNTGGSPLGMAINQLIGGIPLSTFIKGVLQQGHIGSNSSVYPAAQGSLGGIPIQDWILFSRFFGGGGLTARPYNPQAGQQSAYRETHPIP